VVRLVLAIPAVKPDENGMAGLGIGVQRDELSRRGESLKSTARISNRRASLHPLRLNAHVRARASVVLRSAVLRIDREIVARTGRSALRFILQDAGDS